MDLLISKTDPNTIKESTEYIKNLLTQNLPQPDQINLDNELYKNFLLLKHKSKSKKEVKSRKKKNYITRKEKSKLQIPNIGRNSFVYNDLLPLHNLWRQYIRDFLELDKFNKIPNPGERVWDSFSTLLLKADYHGAMFTVIRSKCPSVVNHTGICVMETKNTLYLVDLNNITRQIPKAPSVFKIYIDDRINLIVFGKHMAIRPAERSTKKLKNYALPDL